MKQGMAISRSPSLLSQLSLQRSAAFAQDNFYQGKTVRIIVGASAGGGYDTYSRTIARHMGKHVPGNPTFVVENMPGAGFLISANYMYKIAKPDGLTIGHFIGGLFLQQLLGKPGIEFDARKFEYIGVPAQDNYVIGVSQEIPASSTMDQWMSSKTMVKLGGVGAGSATDDIPKVFDCNHRTARATRLGLQRHRGCEIGLRQPAKSKGCATLGSRLKPLGATSSKAANCRSSCRRLPSRTRNFPRCR